jgi:hypothetical protein
MLLWLEIHGHVAQPLPALAAACEGIAFELGASAACSIGEAIALRRPAVMTEGQRR